MTSNISKYVFSCKNKVDLVIITGGLGPTKDDITKHTFVNILEISYGKRIEVLAHITQND